MVASAETNKAGSQPRSLWDGDGAWRQKPAAPRDLGVLEDTCGRLLAAAKSRRDDNTNGVGRWIFRILKNLSFKLALVSLSLLSP
jgi:hypothetical protein